jgi:hypothetical protein
MRDGRRPGIDHESRRRERNMLNHRDEDREKAAARLMTRIALGAFALAAALGIGLLASGCGAKTDESAAAVSSDPVYTVSQPGGTGGITNAVMEGNDDGRPAVPSDSLPPDVAVTVESTEVIPGTAIEISAEGSDDVVSMTLDDGLHQKQILALDQPNGVWRTMYRVPLRPAADRFGLAVTAKNGAGRWRRVWLFLQVPGVQPTAAAADTTDKS